MFFFLFQVSIQEIHVDLRELKSGKSVLVQVRPVSLIFLLLSKSRIKPGSHVVTMTHG